MQNMNKKQHYVERRGDIDQLGGAEHEKEKLAKQRQTWLRDQDGKPIQADTPAVTEKHCLESTQAETTSEREPPKAEGTWRLCRGVLRRVVPLQTDDSSHDSHISWHDLRVCAFAHTFSSPVSNMVAAGLILTDRKLRICGKSLSSSTPLQQSRSSHGPDELPRDHLPPQRGTHSRSKAESRECRRRSRTSVSGEHPRKIGSFSLTTMEFQCVA